MKTFNYALVMMLLVILSCQKEDLTPLPEESLSGNQTVSFRSTPIADRDADLVNAFYEDLLDLQDRTGFYDTFYEQYGYIAWSKTIEYVTPGVGKLLAIPVQSPNGGTSNGMFLYYSAGSDKRIQFIDRTEVETKISANAFSEISKDEEFAYRNFLLTDLKSGIATENLSPPDMDVFFGGEGEGSSCQGGSFEHICVYITGGLEGLDARTLVGDYMDENYGVYGTIDDQFDGFTIDELTTYLQSEGYNNTGPSGISSEDYLELQRYYNDRLAFYLATGIGGDISGVLSGYRPAIDLEVECFDVWVWCWQDPADFGIMIGGGGGGGGGNEDFHPTWQEEYVRLRFCEGVNDIFDTGPDNPSQLHPDYDFCAIWMAYLEDCILPNQPGFNEFEAISSYEGLILTWAEFQYNNPELFTAVIADPADCTPTNELDDYTPEDENLIDEECRNALLDFLATYGITLTKEERLAILTSGGNPECTDQEAFEEWVITKTAELFSSRYDHENPPSETAVFFDRTLECFSFNFIPQTSGAGQIACLDNLYLSKNFGGLHSNTDFFCGHFTLPRVRYSGEVISAGKAADCAAWAANAAATIVGFAFAESPDYSMTDEAMIRLFKETFRIKMALTDCGYGVMTNCEAADCLATPSSALWNEGFFEWLDEQFFGCE
ncbi:hypothetical protein [Lewinella cohaerens]|uniref:hypothetical protein n=1 Tax=Lewinella cohaerens TaxID=70995 RepID=UPI0003632D90|nr:hypothetical protein [Lewinella cohaerens]